MRHNLNGFAVVATVLVATASNGATHAEDAMSPGVHALEEIVVSADALRRGKSALSQAVTVLDEESLNQRPLSNIGDMLDGLPGIANADFGPGVGRPVIRGLQGARVGTLEDGLPTADVAGEGADHAIAVDPARARQIEIYRGPATLLYGSGATGGVINIRTQRFEPGIESQPQLRGAFTYGENGNDRQAYLATALPLHDRFVMRADASVRHTDDFDINGFQQVNQSGGRRGTLVNSSLDTESYSLSGVWKEDWGYAGVGISTWKTDYGIPENFDARPRELGGQSDEFERIEAKYERIDLRGQLEQPVAGLRSLRFSAAYTRFDQEEIEFGFERNAGGGRLDERNVEAEFTNDEWEIRLEAEHEVILGWQGVLGFQYSDRDFTAGVPGDDAENFFIRPNRTRTGGLFLLEQREVTWGSIEWSTRFEHQESRPTNVLASDIDGVTGMDGSFIRFPLEARARNFNALSLSTGAIRDLGDEHRLQLVATRAQRMPSPEQLFAFGRHPAAGTFEIGDQNLSEETYLNLDIGLERYAGRLQYEARLFYSWIDNFIFLRSVDDGTGRPVAVNDIGERAGEGQAGTCSPGDSGGDCNLRNQLVFNQQEDARLYGAELAAAYGISRGNAELTLRFSGDYLRGRLRGADGNLPRMTPSRLGFGMDAVRGSLRLSADLRRVFRQSRIGVAEDESEAFNLLSFTASWQPPALPAGELFLQGRNLLNEDGRLHQSFFRNQAPIIGRAVYAGLRFDIGG